MENNSTQPSQPSSNISGAAAPEPSAPLAAPKEEMPKPEPNKGPVTPKSPSKIGKLLLVLLVVLLAAAGAAYGGYTKANGEADKKEAKLNTKIAALEATEHEIPADAVKLSGCIPNMGFHYLPKNADPTYGPFLLVNVKGKVIGAEYMISNNMYTAIPNVTPPVELVMKDGPLFGWAYDHLEVSHAPKGHHGLPEDHVDVHLYTVSKADQKQSCQK